MNAIENRISMLCHDTDIEIRVTDELKLSEGMLYVYDYGDTSEASVIVYDDGVLMQQRDWQSGHPDNEDEICNYDWLDEQGRNAILFDGLPRQLAYGRVRIGEQLRQVRMANHISISQMAKLSGVNSTTIWKIEIGRFNPSIDIINKISSVVGYKVGLLEQ